ncbi:hypothetical protein [Streptomyces sp. 184]|uniref:hypothetical protein n=1 Tax=Streptomyces sp. 184 TaxID=1827526 RepID=UPI003891D3C8
MTDPTITDLRRELDKARDALIAAQTYLAYHAEANAALHCATTTHHSPLHAKVTAAIQGIEHALTRTEQAVTGPPGFRDEWARLAADLDRCEHGHHEGDVCGDTCVTASRGNPHLRPGQVIGYGLRGDPIYMPTRENKHDPAAWRTPAADDTPEENRP